MGDHRGIDLTRIAGADHTLARGFMQFSTTGSDISRAGRPAR
jgi:hypothetical protein